MAKKNTNKAAKAANEAESIKDTVTEADAAENEAVEAADVTEAAENETVDTAEVNETAEETNKEASENKKSKPEAGSKKSINRRKLKYGSVAAAITVIVIALVVMVNVIVNLSADKVNMSIDLTTNGSFEISQETKDYLATVNEPVSIVCMSDEITFQTAAYIYYKQAYEVLKKYSIYNNNIDLKFVDMVEDPTYADRYNSIYKGEINAYNIVVESSKRIKVLSIEDLYNTQINYNTFSQEIVSSKAEQELTSAIMYVTDPNPLKAVVFKSDTSGSSYDNLVSLLNSNGYDVSEIDPLVDIIPEGADIVAINAPLNDYDESIINMLYDFLDNNGNLGKNLIYVADYSQKDTKNIDAFLAEWGLSVGHGVVGDQDANNLQSQSYYVVRNYIESNDFSGNVAQPNLPVIDYQARPVTLLFDTKDTRSTVALLKTKETAFVMTDEMQELARNGEQPEIVNGVQTTMAIGRKYVFNSDNQQVFSNVLVIGSSETLDAAFTETTYYNNGDYFISILNTMTGKNSGISIVAKDLTSPTFDIDQGTVGRYMTVFVIIIPLTVLIIGTVVFIRRRTK